MFTQQEIRKSEKPAAEAEVLAALRDPVLQVDAGGNVVYFNRSAAEKLSLREQSEITSRLQTLNNFPAAFRYLGWTVEVLPADTGHVLHLREIQPEKSADVEARGTRLPAHSAKRRLKAVLRQVRVLFDSVPVACHETDRNGVLRRVNQAECRLLGYPRREMLGHPVWNFVADDFQEAIRKSIEEKLDGQIPPEGIQLQFRTRAGALMTCEVYESAIQNSEGHITGFRAALIDVTHRDRAGDHQRALVRETIAREQAEAASAQTLSILERIGDAYIAFDSDWRYTYVNHKAAQLAQKPASDLLGRCVWEEFPESVHTDFYRELQRSMRDQVSIEFENYYAPLQKWFENTVYPSPSGVSVFYRDITERKRIQQELESTAAELARKNTELETFTYAVSHDLQEPLRTIAGFATLLSKRCAGLIESEAHDYIQFISDGTERLQKLIRDLLTLSRLETGDSAQTCNAREIVTAVCHDLAAVISEAQAVIDTGELPPVTASPTHLRQIFQNLIENAVKYRSSEPPRIVITAEREDDNWCFAVRDNGTGFDMKHANRIFLPFKRLAGRTSEGSGIGLAICKKFIEARGGRIWVESVPRCGSTFYFTIPDDFPQGSGIRKP